MRMKKNRGLSPEFYELLHKIEDEKGSVKNCRKNARELKRLRMLGGIISPDDPASKEEYRRYKNSFPANIEVLEKLREGKTQAEFAIAMGLHDSWYRNVLRSKSMGIKGVKAVEEHYKISRKEFLILKGDIDD